MASCGSHVLAGPPVRSSLALLASPPDHAPGPARLALLTDVSGEALLAALPVVAVNASVSLEEGIEDEEGVGGEVGPDEISPENWR